MCRLHEVGNMDISNIHCGVESVDDSLLILHESSSPRTKHSHCSFCGHPGSKSSHLRSSCEYCCTEAGKGCLKKPDKFKCDCLSCHKVHLCFLITSMSHSMSWPYPALHLFASLPKKNFMFFECRIGKIKSRRSERAGRQEFARRWLCSQIFPMIKLLKCI